MRRRFTARRASRYAFAGALVMAGAAILVHRYGGDRAVAHGSVSVQLERIAFDPTDPARTRFGSLEWRGGLKIAGPPPFGGVSGLAVSPDGARLTAITDKGHWLSARLSYRAGRIDALDDVTVTPILGAPGERFRGKSDKDAEGLAALGENAFLVSFERRHRIARYSRDRKGRFGQARYVKAPEALARLPENTGIEALGVPPGSRPGAPTLVAIAERALDADGNHAGWLIAPDGGGESFSVSRSDGFDITDLAFLPGGDLVLLERRYMLFAGAAFRLRRIASGELRAGAVLRGRILFTADDNFTVDNMEGLAVHRAADGETILSLISDDNFSSAQSTLLLQFAIIEE